MSIARGNWHLERDGREVGVSIVARARNELDDFGGHAQRPEFCMPLSRNRTRSRLPKCRIRHCSSYCRISRTRPYRCRNGRRNSTYGPDISIQAGKQFLRSLLTTHSRNRIQRQKLHHVPPGIERVKFHYPIIATALEPEEQIAIECPQRGFQIGRDYFHGSHSGQVALANASHPIAPIGSHEP